MNDASELIDQIEQNPKAFDILIEMIKDQLNQQGNDDTFEGDFLLRILENMVQCFQVPAVMAVESPAFLKVLMTCVKNGLGEEVKNLLQECLQAFSFDEKRQTIPLISNFYLEYFGSQTFPNLRTPEQSDFIELFCNIQNIMLFNQESDKSEDAENILRIMIESLFEHGKFKSITYSPLEQQLILKYKRKLEEMRDQIVNKKENEKKQKIMKEQQKEALKRLPADKQLKNRTYFVKGEELPFDESIEYEYKDYTFPFSSPLIRTLSKTICSMMNVKGGRIFIGVTDSKIVKGIQLTNVQRAELLSTIEHIVTQFEPDVSAKDYVSVVFLPIYPSEKDNKPIPGLFVTKIIIKQGDPAVLYSNTKEGLECYIRYEGQSKFLNSKETREHLIEKFINPPHRISDFEYRDPKPQAILDIEYAKTAATSSSLTTSNVNSLTTTTTTTEEKKWNSLDDQMSAGNKINIRYPCSQDDELGHDQEKKQELRHEQPKQVRAQKKPQEAVARNASKKKIQSNSHSVGSQDQASNSSNSKNQYFS